MASLRTTSVAGLLVLALTPAAQARPEPGPLPTRPARVVQRLVDRAKPGETVRIPPGVYVGSVTLRKNIGLVGAGTQRTILEGRGAEHVLLVEGSALISKLTVRGGRIGIEFRGGEATLQDAVVTANEVYGVHCLASPVLFNNRIFANGIGVAVNSRSPLLLHNTIAGNAKAGVWSWYGPGPALVHDLVVDNRIALDFGAGSSPEVVDSYEWGHIRPSAGFREEDPGPDGLSEGRLSLASGSPLAEAVGLSSLLRLRPGARQGALYPVGHLGPRRAEVELDRARARRHVLRYEPKLTYRLTPEPGIFQVEVAFSRPPFQLGSSETTSRIEVLRAWDVKDQVRLHAQVRPGPAPGVQVDSFEPDPPMESGRYRLLCEFQDPAALRLAGGKLVFERLTSLQDVQIVPPEGWKLRPRPERSTDKGRLISAEAVPPGAEASP
jgi:hypothetical protein